MISFLGMAGYDPTSDHPLLTDWLNRVRNLLKPNYDEIWKSIPKNMMVSNL